MEQEIKDLTQMQMLLLLAAAPTNSDYLQAVEDRYVDRDPIDRQIAELENGLAELTKELR